MKSGLLLRLFGEDAGLQFGDAAVTVGVATSDGTVEGYAFALDHTPFVVEDETTASEETRLHYRYLDLRRTRPRQNLALRHHVIPNTLHGRPATVYVGGQTALADDEAAVISSKLPVFVAIVVFGVLLLLYRES